MHGAEAYTDHVFTMKHTLTQRWLPYVLQEHVQSAYRKIIPLC